MLFEVENDIVWIWPNVLLLGFASVIIQNLWTVWLLLREAEDKIWGD